MQLDSMIYTLTTMRRPVLFLGTSAAALIVGSAVCYPGLGGCGSWLGWADSPASWRIPFAILSAVGTFCLPASLIWFLVSSIRASLRK